MAFGFHPETGDLWITDNGIDGFEDVWVSYSADESNVIPAAEIGGAVEDFGFPFTYTLYESGEVVGSGGIQPVVAFVPLGGAENEGVASLAFTPAGFASGFGQGVVVGFHGQYDKCGSGQRRKRPAVCRFDHPDCLDYRSTRVPGCRSPGHAGYG